jgi:hypothetical protein
LSLTFRVSASNFTSLLKILLSSGLASEHLHHIGACDARAKEAITTNLADVSYFIADWGDPLDGREKPLLYVLGATQTLTSSLLRLWREEEGRDLTQVKDE